MNLYVARYIDRWIGALLCFLLHVAGRVLRQPLAPIGRTTPPVGGDLPLPRRVLGIKFYGLGNIVMILPVLNELRLAAPGVEIDFLTLPGNVTLLEQSGLVRRALTTDVTGYLRFARSVMRLFSELRRRQYDAVLDFEQFMKLSAVFAFVTGAPLRIGLSTEGQRRDWLYTTRVAYTDSDHTTDIFRRLIAPFGACRGGRAPSWFLPVSADARAAARALLETDLGGRAAPTVVLHVGTGPNYRDVALKRWGIERFAAVADHLADRYGMTVVFTGVGSDERGLIAYARSRMRRPSVDACDRLDLPALAGLLAEAAFVVSNDTSVMHLAGIIGTPVVAPFGPTSPRSYGPRGPRDLVFYKQLYCSPCISNYNLKMSRCTRPVCMEQISVEEVIEGIERHLFAPPSRDAAAEQP